MIVNLHQLLWKINNAMGSLCDKINLCQIQNQYHNIQDACYMECFKFVMLIILNVLFITMNFWAAILHLRELFKEAVTE